MSKYTEEQQKIIRELQRLTEEKGARLVKVDVPETFIYRINKAFGPKNCWNTALEAAGYPRIWKMPDQKLLDDLADKCRKLRRPPTCKEINDDPNMRSYGMYHRRFGSINRAFELIGVDPAERPFAQQWDTRQAFEALRQKGMAMDHLITTVDVNHDKDLPSYHYYLSALQRLGIEPVNWRNVLVHAGLPLDKPRRRRRRKNA